MNTKFKLGSVVVPVDTNDEGQPIEIKVEGIEIEVTDLDLNDYIKVLKAVPTMMKELKEVMEEDNSGPSAADILSAFQKGREASKDPINTAAEDFAKDLSDKIFKLKKDL